MKLTLTLLAVALLATPLMAYQLEVVTVNDPIQDDWSLNGWVHELGTAPTFPADEEISAANLGTTTYTPCPTDYQGGTNYRVQITNNSGREWECVYYVADWMPYLPTTTITNYDEFVGNPGSGDEWLTFKIDNLGANTPLVYESLIVDNMFQPGEVWEFVLQDFNSAGSPHWFGSLGIGANSAEGMPLSSTGSILAVVPEPSSVALLALAALGVQRRRR